MTAWNMTALSAVLIDAKLGFACGADPRDGVFQFRMNNITTEGQLDFSKKRRVPRDTRGLDSFVVEPGDVLFNATNSPDLVGKSAFFSGYSESAVFSNHFLRLRPREGKLDGRYLAQWLLLQFQRGVFHGMCRQWVNQATVNRDSLLALQIPLPSLPEQRRIADILNAAEELCAKRRAALVQLDMLAQSVFFDTFGDPATNPKGWATSALGDVLSAVYRYPTYYDITYVEQGVPEVRGELIQEDGGIITLKSRLRYISPVTSARFPLTVLAEGDLVMSVRGTVGKVGIVPASLAGANMTANLIRMAPNRSIIDPVFTWHFMQTASFKERLTRACSSTTILTIKAPDLKRLVIPVPPLPLQHHFARHIGAIRELGAKNRSSLADMDALFASLQHRAFRGEL